MSDLHEVHFKWPSTEPSVVVVTGTFDEWRSSVHLVKTENGFSGSVRIPWDTKIYYKYVVDSKWVCESTSPTETDSSGNVNNVYTSPPEP
ncbi:carbohydrate-binding module family 48 protein, partial [Mycena haematopus]